MEHLKTTAFKPLVAIKIDSVVVCADVNEISYIEAVIEEVMF